MMTSSTRIGSLMILTSACLGHAAAGSEPRPKLRGLAKNRKNPPSNSGDERDDSRRRHKPKTLLASMDKYPGYNGDLDITGTIAVRFGDDGHYLFHVDVRGLEKDATGGVHIHAGTTCDGANTVGGHYWRDGRAEDNWTTDGGAVWRTDENGRSISSFRLFNGYGFKRNAGHAVVIHEADGTRAACGILRPNDFVLSAEMGAYPPYDGKSDKKKDLSNDVGGNVKLFFDADGNFEMYYNLDGVPKRCSDCGVHVHMGTTCEDHDDVGGHYYTKAAGDLWTASGGAVYNSGKKGKAKGSFPLFDGYSFTEHVNHAVVVHAEGGERIGCGVLSIEDKRLTTH